MLYCAAGTAVGLAAFMKIGGPLSKMVFFIVFCMVNAVLILIYFVSQIILVLIALDDRWSLGTAKILKAWFKFLFRRSFLWIFFPYSCCAGGWFILWVLPCRSTLSWWLIFDSLYDSSIGYDGVQILGFHYTWRLGVCCCCKQLMGPSKEHRKRKIN